jgi:NTP pyrophosphatase (non-canonical NTP hydrolase)
MNERNTMNADDAIKALRICNNPKGDRCSQCPVLSRYDHRVCKATVDRFAATLIESQAAEIATKDAEIARLTAELEAARFIRSDTARDALTKAQGERIKTLEGEKEAISKLYLDAHNERVDALAELDRLTEAQRTDVQTFAAAMERTLKRHDDRPGWEEESPQYLFDRLQEEYEELLEANEKYPTPRVMNELVDVANFCMMLYCNFVRAGYAPEKGE